MPTAPRQLYAGDDAGSGPVWLVEVLTHSLHAGSGAAAQRSILQLTSARIRAAGVECGRCMVRTLEASPGVRHLNPAVL